MAQVLLVVHVVAGLVGSVVPLVVFFESFKKSKTYSEARVQFYAVTAFALIMISWITAGLYYLNTYGPSVKPRIKESYPWVHSIIMETKEHVFLFIPILAALLVVIAYRGNSKHNLLLRYTAAAIVVLGVLMIIGGLIISGARELTM